MTITTKTLDTASWTELQAVILDLGEDECLTLLKHEKTHKRRQAYLLRLHSRLNKIRAHRERAELRALAL